MTVRHGFIVALIVSVVAAGCATPPTPAQQGAVIGAGAGAATGAVVGAATGGGAGKGALLGAIIGGLGGAIAGDIYQQGQQRAYEQGRQDAARPGAPQPGGPPVTGQGPYAPDPTRGEISNATRWEVQIHLDQQAGNLGAPTFVLNPQESRPVSLDIGQHRIIAKAFVSTQFGKRPVGTYDRTVTVDPRASGWSIRFVETSF
ncbi:MAG: hypothetical protein HYY54_07615 [candidate division NC10 bacterium]|nr:hypothetical protein [candidate division NC10 bacterium]MBI3003466.1 hypothetical protein [candidate division NC10 bacterium]MBI4390470.1 hypothetical protein [candidate division NC10 bacterium]